MKTNYWETADENYVKNTGKEPAAWRKILDGWGAESKTATEIVTYLRNSHGLSKWWSRAVAAHYQVDKGIRPLT
jgi:hypothetical protein